MCQKYIIFSLLTKRLHGPDGMASRVVVWRPLLKRKNLGSGAGTLATAYGKSGWCGGQKMAPHVNKWSPLDGAHD